MKRKYPITIIGMLLICFLTANVEAEVSLLRDINPFAASSSPGELTNVSGTLFFAADDGVNGRELWKSDGTPGGTLMLEDISPGAADSAPSELTAVNGTLFFTR